MHHSRAATQTIAAGRSLHLIRGIVIAPMTMAGSRGPTPGSCIRLPPKCSVNRGHARRLPVRIAHAAAATRRRRRYSEVAAGAWASLV
jgi:hypothetical protein